LRHTRGITTDTSHTFKTRRRKHASIDVLSAPIACCMPTTPRLVTDDLELLRAARSDTWELWELWRQPAVHEPLFGPSSMPVDTAIALLAACARGDAGVWVLRSRQTSRLLGALSLCGWPHPAHGAPTREPQAHCGEFSVALLPSARGRGHAHHAARVLLSYAFSALGMSAMAAVCSDDDASARRLLGRLGFRIGSQRPGPAGPCADYTLSKHEFRPAAGMRELERRDFAATVPLR
jgi:RimJ/RimL family protein N-acetyltransferase